MRFGRITGDNTPRGHTLEAIKRMILVRGYRVGDKLPGYRQLADHFGVALFTIERVMKDLAADGVIHLLHGKGAFIKHLPAANGQLRQVGLIYPASRVHLVRSGYMIEILSGMVEYCEQHHVDLQILSFWEAGKRVPIPPHETAIRIDGAVLLGVPNDSYVAEFAREEIPLVVLDGQTQVAGVHSIGVDNAQGTNLVMEYLCSLGHHQISYLDSATTDPVANVWADSCDTRERREAYEAAMQRLGLAEHRQIYSGGGVSPAEAAQRAVDCVRRQSEPPTAVVVYDTTIGKIFVEGLARIGLRVPEDISIAGVIGASNQPTSDNRVMTCAHVDFAEMGRMAMHSLARQAGGAGEDSPLLERAGTSLVVGQTVSAPRA